MGLIGTLTPPIVVSNVTPFVYGNTNNCLIITNPNSSYQIGFKIENTYGKELYSDPYSGNSGLIQLNNGTIPIGQIEKEIGANYDRNEYYRIRLRYRNGNNYSNWSDVILVRFIAQPDLDLNYSAEEISGTFSFNDLVEKEFFQSCYIEIETLDKKEKFETTIQLKNNSFYYSFPKIINNYHYKITYTTVSGYTGIEEGDKTSMSARSKSTSFTISAVVNDTNNIVTITTSGMGAAQYSIKRCPLYGAAQIIKENITGNISFTDTTCEDGMPYTYKVETATEYAESSQITIFLDNAILMNKNKVYSIALDEDVSGLKYVTVEAITNTIGSKYPYFNRNSDTKYKQFTLGGTISKLLDLPSVSFNDIIGSTKGAPSDDAPELNDGQKDYFVERMYREEIIAFLTDSQPKLFKSASEGNVLIMLTNISFTPNKQLGRKIYSFSATATEIDECTFENYIKYAIV